MLLLMNSILLLLLLKETYSYSLVDNDNYQYQYHFNPYHDMTNNVQNKIFLHKLNVWRKHYRNFTREQIIHNKKRFELADNYITDNNSKNKNIKKNIAIIWRCHNSTTNAINRIKKWAKEFQEKNDIKSDIKYSLHISMDVSEGTKIYLETKRVFKDYDILFHSYSNQNMTKSYPILNEMLKRVPPYFFHQSLSVAKGFHIESICLWWSWINNIAIKISYDYIWIIEDDIGITGGLLKTGSLYEFVDLYDKKNWKKRNDEYENNNPDLITYGKYQTFYHGTYYDRWVYHDTVSNAYALLTHETEQFYTQEHVQRFSARYLNLLHYYIKTHKITAWSEQSSISIITSLKPHWRVGYIEYGNIGQYEVIKRINQTQFEKIQSIENNSSTNPIKLWHALKW